MARKQPTLSVVPSRSLRIIGVPLDLGQTRRGVDMGPSAIRAAELQKRLRLLDFRVEDVGNIAVAIPETQRFGDRRNRYLGEIAAVCRETAEKVRLALAAGRIPLVLGGDHSIAIGTVAGLSHYYSRRPKSFGLIWLDAHADINTPETSPSGNVHGMPLACCVGIGPTDLSGLGGTVPMIDPARVALVGVRSVDENEKANLDRSGVRVFSMRDIDERGMRRVMDDAIEVASGRGGPFHVSLDMDFVDPGEAPGVGTPVRGGASYREAHLALEMIADSKKMCSMEIVEVNPILDVGNRTGSLAVELALSAFGKRIV